MLMAMGGRYNMVRVDLQDIRMDVYIAVGQGILAWTVYAIVECVFSSIFWIFWSRIRLPFHSGFTALLFLFYPLVGLILGGLSGVVLYMMRACIRSFQKVPSRMLFRAVATSTVILAFDVNIFIRHDIGLSVIALLVISLLLVTLQVISAASTIWSRRLAFLTSPWTAIILLLGLAWINLELLTNHSRTYKVGMNLAFLIGMGLIAFLIDKAGRRQPIDHSLSVNSQIRSFAFTALVGFIVLGTSFFVNQESVSGSQDLKTIELSNLKPGQPNVILITLDTVRADHLSVYGYERDTTPNLKKFSEEATIYHHAISTGDMTLPAHASIFTGMYARRHGAHYDPPNYPRGRPLKDTFQTLPELLFEKGYSTIGIVANYGPLAPAYGLNQGFAYYDARLPVSFLRPTNRFFLRQTVSDSLAPFVSLARGRTWGKPRTAEEINQEVFMLLEEDKESNRPFFLFINYMEAHVPYIPPSPFDRLYPGKDELFSWDYYYGMKRRILNHESQITDKDRRHLVSQYDGAIANLDFNLGRLFAQLRRLNQYENSLIIITSDHGEAFGNRQLLEHAVSVYQDQIHVPLIIKYPGSRQKAVVGENVSIADIMPTVLDVLGYEVPQLIQGRSLLKQQTERQRVIVSESFPDLDFPALNRVERAIFKGPFKLISSTAGKREVYDLLKDPNEELNIYSQGNRVVMNLEASLSLWLKTVQKASGSTGELDQETLNKLESLGYVQ
jgi:arylsulfatase A-like enzyme